ncbi:FtsX-like permease family protein [Nocardia sp. NPDC127579]|uniref:ABC transporter permease n=1 Tax=Nocardia sp. NPDC127579 TaxID=3345402 RepID=UPI003624E612
MFGAWLDRLRVLHLRELRSHRARALISIGVVAVSAMLMVTVVGITGSISGSVDKLAEGVGGAARLEVLGITDSGFDQSLSREIAAIDGVRAAVPMLRSVFDAESGRTLLLGVDSTVMALGSDLLRAVGGGFEMAAELAATPNGVAIGTGLGLAEGASFELGSARVTAAAVLDSDAARRINGGHFVLAPLGSAQLLLDRPGSLDSILIVPKPGSDVRALRSRIEAVVAGRAVVADPNFRAAQTGSGIAMLRYTTLMAAAVSLIVAAFLVYTTTTTVVSQRRAALSTLRALGGRPRSMVRDLLTETALLALVAATVGGALGVLAGRLAIGALPPALVQTVEARLEYILPPRTLLGTAVVCVAVTVAAAGLAARDVHRATPIQALTPLGAEPAPGPGGRLRAGAALAGLAAAIAAGMLARADVGRLSTAALALAFLAAVCLCCTASGAIVRAAAALTQRFGAPGVLAATSLRRAPKRVWATVMTVTIAVAMTVTITGSSGNVLDSTGGYFRSLAGTELWVGSQPADSFSTAPLPPGTAAAVAAIPGVATVLPSQFVFATVRGTRALLQGHSPELRHPVFDTVDPAVRARIDAGLGVLVSRDLARALGVSTGSTLELPTPKGIRHTEVLGVIPYFSVLAGAVVAGLDQLRDWFDRPGATLLGVHLSPGADPGAVEKAVRQAIPATAHVFTGAAAVAGVRGAVAQGAALTWAITWIIGGVAAVALLNTFMLSVLERRRELGVLRATGAGRRFLLRSVLAEAAGVAVVGALLGLGIGSATQYLGSIVSSAALGLDIGYRASPATAGFALLALAVSLLGAVPPALRAARLPVVDALEAR